jgi:uncharacterized protein (TIGR03435 family)
MSGVVALGGLMLTAQLCAQSPVASTVAFEVASVKPQPWKGQGRVGVFVKGDTLSAEHCSLVDLVEFAWNLREIQLSGGPAWARSGFLATSDLYEVIGKAESESHPSMAQFRLMLQAVLAERFKLEIHHASKDLPVFNLVPMKNGPKLTESAADAKFSMAINSAGDGGRVTRITGRHASIEKVIGQIEHAAGRPVFDKTGLTGFYDFEIEVTAQSAAASADGSVTDSTGDSIFTALQRQLGLRLEPATAAFDTVVIDHAEKPTEN